MFSSFLVVLGSTAWTMAVTAVAVPVGTALVESSRFLYYKVTKKEEISDEELEELLNEE